MSSAAETTAVESRPKHDTGWLGSPAAAYALLVVVMLTWAGNSIVARAIRADVPPFTLALVRWSGGLLLMAPFAISALRRDAPLVRAGWRMIVLLGLSGVAAFNGFLYLGVHYTTATNAILLQGAIPPLILVVDRLVLGTRARGLQIVGTLLSTAGVLLVVSRADLWALLTLRFGFGDLLVFGGVVGWALYTVLLPRRPRLRPLSFLALTFAIGALAMLPFAVAEWVRGEAVRWSPATVGALAYVVIAPSLVGYSLYNHAVQTIGAARAGQTVTIMPVIGAGLAALLLGEPLRLYHFGGMALILAGIVAAVVSARRARAAEGVAH